MSALASRSPDFPIPRYAIEAGTVQVGNLEIFGLSKGTKVSSRLMDFYAGSSTDRGGLERNELILSAKF